MILLRAERPEDIPAIRRVNEAAFGRPDEARLVDNLRQNGAAILSLVALMDNKVVGHILFSPVEVVSENETYDALALGPMAVDPSYQSQGVGSRLVRTALDELRQRGEDLIFVLGHADYYPRFGFKPTQPYGIHCEFDVPAEVFMVIELREGALEQYRGTVVYGPEFHDL